MQHRHQEFLNQLNLLQDQIDAGNWSPEAQSTVKRILKISDQPKTNILRATRLLVNGQRALALAVAPIKKGPFKPKSSGAKIDITDQLMHLKFIGGRTKKKRKIGEPEDPSRSQQDKEKGKKKLMKSMGYGKVASRVTPDSKDLRAAFRIIRSKQSSRHPDSVTNEEINTAISQANFASFAEFMRVLYFSTNLKIPSPPSVPKKLAQARKDAEKNFYDKQTAYNALSEADGMTAMDEAWDEQESARKVLEESEKTFTQQEIYTKTTSQLSILNSNLIVIQKNINKRPTSYTRDMIELKALELIWEIPAEQKPRYNELLKLKEAVEKLDSMKSETKQKILEFTAMQKTALASIPTSTELAAHPNVKPIHEQYIRAHYTILYFVQDISQTVLSKKMRHNRFFSDEVFSLILKYVRGPEAGIETTTKLMDKNLASGIPSLLNLGGRIRSSEKITYYLPEFIKAYAIYMVMIAMPPADGNTRAFVDNMYYFILNPQKTDIKKVKYSMQLLGNGFSMAITRGGEKQVREEIITRLTSDFIRFSEHDQTKRILEEIKESGITRERWILNRAEKYMNNGLTPYPNSNIEPAYYGIVEMLRFRNLPMKEIEYYMNRFRHLTSTNETRQNNRDLKTMMTMLEKVAVQLEDAVRFPLENGFAEYVIAPFWATWDWRQKWYNPRREMTKAEKKKHSRKNIWEMLDDSAHLKVRKRRMELWQIATHLVRIASKKWSTTAMYIGWKRDKAPTIPEESRLNAYELAVAALVAMHLESMGALLHTNSPFRLMISVIGPYGSMLLSEYNSLILQPLETWGNHPMMSG